MSLKWYVRIWIILTCFLFYEYYALNFDTRASFFHEFQKSAGLLKGVNLTPDP